MQKITSSEQFQQIIVKSKPTVAVFKADWCKDCRFIDPFMPNVVEKYSSTLQFVEVDRDELPELCEQYGILGIPSFIVFCEGQQLVSFISKLRKTQDEIEQFLDRAIEVANALKSSKG